MDCTWNHLNSNKVAYLFIEKQKKRQNFKFSGSSRICTLNFVDCLIVSEPDHHAVGCFSGQKTLIRQILQIRQWIEWISNKIYFFKAKNTKDSTCGYPISSFSNRIPLVMERATCCGSLFATLIHLKLSIWKFLNKLVLTW